MDAVICLGDASANGNDEIRILLRSIEKFYRDVGTVFITGFIPDFLKPSRKLVLVPNKLYKQEGIWKDLKMWEQVLLVLSTYKVSDDFLMMNDDQFITREMGDDDFQPMWLKKFSKGDSSFDETIWKKALKKELIMFEKLNGKAFYFEPHVWTRFNKRDFTLAYFDCVMRNIREPVMYSYIYNFMKVACDENNKCHDHRFYGKNNWKDAVENGFSVGHIAYCDNAFNHDEFKARCFELFPNKSKFEK